MGKATVDKSDGLAGGAIIFWYVIGGAIVGLFAGISIPKYLSSRLLTRLVIFVGAISFISIVILIIRFRNQQSEKSNEGEFEERPKTAAPKLMIPIVLLSSQYLVQERLDLQKFISLPMGMGVAAPSMKETLYLYGRPKFDQMPDMLNPLDSITFEPRIGYDDIATAPPYLVPEAMKLDYNVLFFRVVSITRFWIEVIINSTNGQTIYLDRNQVNYQPWADFFLNINSVERLDVEANPVRLKPIDQASILASGPNEPLTVLGVAGDWLMVSTNGLADKIRPVGYIRWRKNGRLAVTYNLFS